MVSINKWLHARYDGRGLFYCTSENRKAAERRLCAVHGSLAYLWDTMEYGVYDPEEKVVAWFHFDIGPSQLPRIIPALWSTGININDLMDAWETEKTAKIFKEDIDELL